MAGYDAGGTLTFLGGAALVGISVLGKVPMVADMTGHLPPGALGAGGAMLCAWGAANILSSTKK
ncbi:MAG: hypothetical protein WC759_02900 [Candidatus Micrarchaeia archaeon]|jgi:hypothetical protein